MKTLLTAIGFSLFISISYSQSITLSEFISYRKLNDKQFEEKLEKTNLELDDVEDISGFITRTTFKNVDVTNATNDLILVNHLKNDKSERRNRVSFQFKNEKILDKYFSEMKSLNFKKVLYKVIDRQMINVYSDGFQTLEVIVSKNFTVNDINVYYTIAIYDYVEYTAQFAEENTKYKVQGNNELDKMNNTFGLYTSLK